MFVQTFKPFLGLGETNIRIMFRVAAGVFSPDRWGFNVRGWGLHNVSEGPHMYSLPF